MDGWTAFEKKRQRASCSLARSRDTAVDHCQSTGLLLQPTAA
jgi:hypothetical protein